MKAKNNARKAVAGKTVSIALLLLTAIIWGFAFVAQRVGAESLGPFSFNGIRFALGAISLIPVVLIFEKQKADGSTRRNTVLYGSLAGGILFAASALQQYGITITQSAGRAGFITGLYTVLVPLIAFVLFRQKNSVFVWIGALLAVLGLFLICVNDSVVFGLGDVILLAGAFLWAAHILMVDRVVDKVQSLRFAMVQFAVCSALNWLFVPLLETLSVAAIEKALWPILYGGFMSVGVAYTLQIIGQHRVHPTLAAILLSTESVFSVVGGALFLNETMTLRGYIGCVLIFAGIVLSQLKRKARKASAESEAPPLRAVARDADVSRENRLQTDSENAKHKTIDI